MSPVGGEAVYRVLNRQAPRQACDQIVAQIAEQIRTAVAAVTPRDSGTLAGAWEVTKIKPSVYVVSNPTRYGRYVEYGTRHMPARPTFGQTIARFRAQVMR